MDLKPLTNSELKNIASNGNGFSKIEHARQVAARHEGSEVIVEKQGLYYLYNSKSEVNIRDLKKDNRLNIIEFVDSQNQILNIKNSEGLQGIGERLKREDIKQFASDGNKFRLFRDAEAVARQLDFDTAIVEKQGFYYLYNISSASSQNLRSGDNSLIDTRVVGVVRNKNTLSNWGFASEARRENNQLAYVRHSKIMLGQEEFKMAGLNVYGLADIAAGSEEELAQTLKTIKASGANTVRFWAFSRHEPDVFGKILDTSQKLNLDLKFIPVFGNHWQDCEAPASKFKKDDNWYRNSYKQEYLPHVMATVSKFIDRKEILMWELMNEPEANHQVLRNFADDVSTRIRDLYKTYEKQNHTELPRHLISLGTLGGAQRPGMVGHEYKDLFVLPNIDVVTAHDYTFDRGESGENNVSGLFQQYIEYARDLNKPFFVGEIGIKAKEGERSPEQALKIMHKRLNAYKKHKISGALLWGPQPLGHSKDGHGYGFDFDSQHPERMNLLQKAYEVFTK